MSQTSSVAREALIVSKPPSGAAKALEGRRILDPPQVGGVWLVLRRHHQGQRRPPPLDRRRQGQPLCTLRDRRRGRERRPARALHVLQLDEYRTTDDAEYDSWSRSSHPEERRWAVRWRPARQRSRRQKRWRWTPHSEPSNTDTSAHPPRWPAGQRGPRCASRCPHGFTVYT